MAPAPARLSLARAGLLAAALAVTAAACSDDGDPPLRRVAVDGGTASVAGLAPVVVEAVAGDDVVIRNANTSDTGAPSHLFVAAPADALPPLFVGQRGGAVPNSGVWGACRGGDASKVAGTCPVPPVEGPARWDGRAYLSTGQLLPGEEAVVPLDEDIAPGRHRLVCALHPELTVDIEVVERPGRAPAPRVDAAAATAEAARATPGAGRVTAGVLVGSPGAEVAAFVPELVRIRAGEPVTWTVGSRSPHTVELGLDSPPELVDTSAEEAVPSAPDRWDGRSPVRSGFLSTDRSAPGGSRFTFTFPRPGTYRYYCRFHPGMTGVVQVG